MFFSDLNFTDSTTKFAIYIFIQLTCNFFFRRDSMELPARVRTLSGDHSSQSSLFTTRTQNSSPRSETPPRSSSGRSKRRSSTALSDGSRGTWPSFNAPRNFYLDFNNSHEIDTFFNITGANSNPNVSGVDEIIFNPIKRSYSF